MKSFLFWIVVIVLVVIPCYFVWECLETRKANIEAGAIRAKIWLPSDCEVGTDDKWYYEKFLVPSVIRANPSFDNYKKEFGDTGKHLVFILQSGEVHYQTMQGKVRVNVSAMSRPSSPSFVDIKEFKYLGNGEIEWTVEENTIGIFTAILGGLFGGIVIDMIIGVVCAVCCGIGLFIYDKFRGY